MEKVATELADGRQMAAGAEVLLELANSYRIARLFDRALATLKRAEELLNSPHFQEPVQEFDKNRLTALLLSYRASCTAWEAAKGFKTRFWRSTVATKQPSSPLVPVT